MSDEAVRYEKRFAVVMYGGVSLAVYINGVAQELYRLVRSTSPQVDENSLVGSERVYQKIASDLKARFVVDILAGTSAGGINAVYLAKSLANNQPFSGLADLWVNEADIEKLVYDDKSLDDTTQAKRKSDLDAPKSLLNGYRIYEKLLDSLNDMGSDNEPGLADELDLFVTATDLQGRPIPLRLADEVVYERQHRSAFHFRKAPPARNDFVQANNGLLAFAARSTSSFPVAFEPIRLSDVSDTKPEWQCLYPGVRAEEKSRFPERALADGGYLDNKPFSYAIDAITKHEPRQPDLPVDRKLIYIEPSPEKLQGAEGIDKPPDAISNAIKAVTLSRYETIQSDLDRIRKRNRLIERVDRITCGTRDDIENLGPLDQPENLMDWLSSDLAKMVKRQGVAYAGYLRLRVARLTDEIAEIITARAGFELDSDAFLGVRYLVRAWRDAGYKYYDDELEDNPLLPRQQERFNQYILDFDLGFHVRRLEFVLDRIDELRQGGEGGKAMCKRKGVDLGVLDDDKFRAGLDGLRSELSTARRRILTMRTLRRNPESGTLAKLTDAIRDMELGRTLINNLLGLPTESQRTEMAMAEIIDRLPAFEQTFTVLHKQVADALKIVKACKKKLGLSGNAIKWEDKEPEPPGEKAAWIIRFYFRMFPHYDLVAYPILQTPDLGEEIDNVEIVRVCPEDPSRLGGSRLGHFGGFFDRTWRKNDILHGRLDGATRLISALVSDNDKRRDYTEEAHKAILADVARDFGKNSDLLGEVVLGGSAADRRKVEENIEARLKTGNGETLVQRITKLLAGGIPIDDLYRRVQDYEVNPTLDRHLVVRTFARSTRVAGKMFTGISEEQNNEGAKKVVIPIAMLGTVLSRLVEATWPGSWKYLDLNRILSLLVLFSAVTLVGGLAVESWRMALWGFVLLAIPTAVWLGRYAFNRWVRKSGRQSHEPHSGSRRKSNEQDKAN